VSDEILRARVELLQANVARVGAVMDWLDSRREDLTSISKAGEDREIWDELAEIKRRVQDVDRQVSARMGAEWDEVRTALQPVPVSIGRIEGRLRKLRELGSSVRMRARDLRGTPSERQLGLLARTCSSRLQDVVKALDGTAGEERQPSAISWGLYRTAAQQCRTLFDEYVELLGGLALRDAGFDADLCRIADEVVKVLETNSQLLTIPSGSERQGESPAHLIRIGFPDWSIWALPLVAHEFGHIFLHEALSRDFDDDKVDATKRLCMADAFATLTLGPAFAAAAFLMRLEPSSCTTADPLVARRAATIRASLVKLDELHPTVLPLGELTGTLAQHWSDSVVAAAEAGQPGAAFDDTGAGEVVELVHDTLLPGIVFPVKEWNTIEDWSDALGTGGRIERLGAPDLRFALNAAWVARLGGNGDLVGLGEAALVLCKELLDPVATAGEGSQGNVVRERSTSEAPPPLTPDPLKGTAAFGAGRPDD
jgi:hypothetical protein